MVSMWAQCHFKSSSHTETLQLVWISISFFTKTSRHLTTNLCARERNDEDAICRVITSGAEYLIPITRALSLLSFPILEGWREKKHFGAVSFGTVNEGRLQNFGTFYTSPPCCKSTQPPLLRLYYCVCYWPGGRFLWMVPMSLASLNSKSL